MKTLRLRLELDEATTHPMHAFVCRREEFSRSRLLHWNVGGDGTVSMIFHVNGTAPDAYAAALAEVESVAAHQVAVRGDESFYVYVRDDLRDADQRLLGTYRGDSLVIVPPVTYRADRSMLFTLVGTAEAVQAAVSETPDDVAVDVLSVRPYDAGAVDSLLRLTDRQREAVRVAVDVGYYGARRAGSVAAVAEELGCSTATAAEHLRKAEAEIMSRVVDRRL
ncbi:helix-turn-helix domain-containing protein [Salinigranum halophilum]|uniref:helix-turn-helix domain-containing protein n=1 Tax=Salinigranum halophilum TaxID=2565931 RepID=UPI0010A91872|nr:helix-turn-helix domain-containing protein [Salinigranum halophilum]